MTARILIVDDHPVVCEGLTMILEAQAGFQVVGAAHTAADALAMTSERRPDIVVLDLDLGGEHGLDLLPHLLAAAPQTRVLVLTTLGDAASHQEALARGARGLVVKNKASGVLIRAIEKVHQGELWFERATVASVFDRVSRPNQPPAADTEAGRIASLTAREREIVALIGQGLRNQQIAETLFISQKTVSNHLTAVFDKLGVKDRFELALFAYRHGLARIPL